MTSNRIGTIKVLILTSPRAYQWRAEADGHHIAGGSGVFGRILADKEAIQFARIKSQQWLVETGLDKAEIIIMTAKGGVL